MNIQKQPTEVFYKKGVLKNFRKISRKRLCWRFVLINTQAWGLFKSTFLQNIYRGLLFKIDLIMLLQFQPFRKLMTHQVPILKKRKQDSSNNLFSNIVKQKTIYRPSLPKAETKVYPKSYTTKRNNLCQKSKFWTSNAKHNIQKWSKINQIQQRKRKN